MVSRSVQDAIFRHRSTVTPIPDFLYQKFKNKYESQMGFNTDQFVNDYFVVAATASIASP